MNELATYKKTVHKYLKLNNDRHIDVCFGVIFANRLNTDPVWLFLVGPPSSGKTAILDPACAHPMLYSLDHLTTQTLVSHHAGKDGQDPSLLPKLHGKTLILPDFTTLLTMRSQDLHMILGQLRRAYDGQFSSKSGIGQVKRFSSKFGCIAAVTDAIDEHRPMMTALGERFLTYRMPWISSQESRARMHRMMERGGKKEMNAALGDAACELLNKPVQEPKLHKPFRNKIFNVAEIVSRGRCPIKRNRFSGEPEIASPENPTRLAGQMMNLAKGIAMARGLAVVGREEVLLVQKVGLDCMTLKRLTLLRAILSKYPKALSSEEVAEIMNFPEPTIRAHLQDLLLLGMLTRRKVLGEKGKMICKYELKQEHLIRELLMEDVQDSKSK